MSGKIVHLHECQPLKIINFIDMFNRNKVIIIKSDNTIWEAVRSMNGEISSKMLRESKCPYCNQDVVLDMLKN